MNGVDTFRSLWEFLITVLLPAFMDFWSNIFEILSLSLYDVVSLGGFNIIGKAVFDLLPEELANTPILVYLLGGGLIVFFAITVIKWVVDLVN